MNLEAIILELLSRIKTLEERVDNLETGGGIGNVKKITTDDIRDYILNTIKSRTENEDAVVLVARDIHRELKLKNSMPMVCNAMKSCMKNNDEILFQTQSGYSSTLKIKYYGQ